MLAGEHSDEADEAESDEDEEDEFGDDEDETKQEGFVREYVEKVATAKMGDNGQNAKSIVASKNDMGGTTANIAKGGEGSKGTQSKTSAKDLASGNVNVPGGKAGVKSLKSVSKPSGGDDGQNKKSTLGA